jgi:hypothetical protein
MTTPPPLPPEGGTTSSGPPWERRDQIGIVAALVETTTQVLSGPEAFFQRMPVTGGITGPLLYGLLIGYVGLVASTLYSLVFNVMFGGFGGLARQSGTLGGTLERLAPFMEGGASLVANLVLGPFFIAIGMFLATGIVHVMLLVLGGARRDFEATFRVIGYAQATSILQIVPVCGSFAHVVYWIVVAIIGLSHAQGITKGKAAAAVLVPLLLVCCCCALGLGVMVATVAGGLASVMGHAQ